MPDPDAPTPDGPTPDVPTRATGAASPDVPTRATGAASPDDPTPATGAASPDDPTPATGAASPDDQEPAEAARVDTVRAKAVDVHPPTTLERVSYALVRGLFLGLAKIYFRLEVRGTDNVPAHGPFVLAPVHRSNLDFILVSTVRRQRMRYMGKASIWRSAALGRFVSMLGAFPVHRGTADRESLRTCMRVIENGEPLVMFPEGTRRSGDTIDEMFDGPAYVASRAGVPLVPVGIGGSDHAMPVGSKMVWPRKIVILVGEPVLPPVGDGTGRVKRRVVRQMTDQLQGDVQALYDESRRLAGG